MPTAGPEDDVTLLGLCREGDDAAWARLVRRYRSLVYSAALRTGLDAEGANEVFQQVWIEVFRSLKRIRDPQALPRWLVVTTRRIAYKHALAHAKLTVGVFDEMVDPRRLPSEELEVLQQRQHLEDLLERLRKPCALLLRLLFLELPRPSYEEIAGRTGVAIGSIGPTRARCLSQLRQLMESHP